MPRGGKRAGAGRKKAEPTKRISVPLNLLPEIESLIQEYKSDAPMKPFPETLEKFIELLPEYQNDINLLTRIGVLFEDWEYLKNMPRPHKKLVIKIMQKS